MIKNETTKRVGRKSKDSNWIIRDLYIKLILKYTKNLGGKTVFGITITQEFLDILRVRYNKLRPSNTLEL